MFIRVRKKMELKKEIESLLFSSGKMMSEKELAELTSHSEQEVKEALESLKKDYDERDTSLVLMNSGNNWKLNVREKYMGLVTKIVADTELPFPILETLGVIAYKAPVMQADIIKARGTNAYEHVGILVEQGFVDKRKEGRSFKLSLTPKFFEYFDVADHEQMKEALKDVKPPEKMGKLEVVDVAPKEEKAGEEKKEGEEGTLGELEVVDVPEKETVDTIKPDHEFLSSIDDRISELSKKNDDLDEDDSFKRTPDLMKELGWENLEGDSKKEGEEEGEGAVEEKKEPAAKPEEEAEEGEDEEGDEETEDDSEEDEKKV
jgi:segregation and condensation protein B